MFAFFGKRFAALRARLTHIGEREPLSKLSLVVILFLDIFVLVTLFSGLEENMSQLSTPEDYVPYDCQNFVVGADLKRENEKLDLVANRVTAYESTYPNEKIVSALSTQAREKLHPICSELSDKIDVAKHTASLRDLFVERGDILTKKNSLQYQIDELKRNYDTALLEKIASMRSEAEKMQNDREKLIRELNTLDGSLRTLETKIATSTEYQSIWNYLLDNVALNQKTLEHDLEVARFWFPVKRLGMDFIFLLPLLLVLYFWNSRSIKKENGIQMLISSHLLVVTFIPTLWKILEMVLEIIPKKFLELVMVWLVSMKLLAIWYYVLVIIGILGALGIIYLIQKKFFNKERLIQKRLISGECVECGKHLPKHVEFCPFCSAAQFKKCESCSAETHIGGTYCIHCGK